MPWASGKYRLTEAYTWFLANWARRLSWKEVAEAFRTTWDHVFCSVPIPYDYEKMLQDTVDDIDDDMFDWLDSNAYKYWPGVNPWLSYCDAFHGRPLTVDTDLDDKTLVESLRKLGMKHGKG